MEKKSRIKRALQNFKDLLLNKKITVDSSFNDHHIDFNLFEMKGEGETITYLLDQDNELKFEAIKKELTLEQFKASLENKVDNTGNVRVWPSEQILAYYLWNNPTLVNKRERICELGAGSSGFAGFVCGIVNPKA